MTTNLIAKTASAVRRLGNSALIAIRGKRPDKGPSYAMFCQSRGTTPAKVQAAGKTRDMMLSWQAERSAARARRSIATEAAINAAIPAPAAAAIAAASTVANDTTKPAGERLAAAGTALASFESALDEIGTLAESGDLSAAERIADGLLAKLKGAPAPKANSAGSPNNKLIAPPDGGASGVARATVHALNALGFDGIEATRKAASEAPAGSVKTMSRAAFNLLPHGARNAFIRNGGKLTESPKPQADPQERARITAQMEGQAALRQAGIEVGDPKKLIVTAAGLAALRGSAGTFRRRLENARNTRERLQVEDDAFAALAGKSGDAAQILRAAGVLTNKTTTQT